MHKQLNWSFLFWAVSLGLLIITAVNFHLPQFDNTLLQIDDRTEGWRLLEPFNLARENNVAVWWSGIWLLTAGMLSYQQFGRGPLRRDASMILAILMVGLSLDEIGSIHERVGSMRIQALFGAVGFVMLGYFAFQTHANPQTRRLAIHILIGFLLYLSVAFQEYLESALAWPHWFRGLRFAVEEGTELLATYVIVRALIISEHGTNQLPWHEVLPRPQRFPGLGTWLTAGAILNTVVAIAILPQFDDLITRGNPASWFPLVVYYLLALAVLHDVKLKSGGRKAGMLFFGCLIFCSIDSVAAFSQYIPKLYSSIEQVIPADVFAVTGSGRYVVHLLLLFCASMVQPMMQWETRFKLLALLLIAVIGNFYQNLGFQLALPGILTMGLAWVLFRTNPWTDSLEGRRVN